MNYANRCPRCGGMADHYITSFDGHCYYRCMNGLTSFEEEEGVWVRGSHIVACDTILDSTGKPYTGTIGYNAGGKAKTLAVTDGKGR